MIYLFFALSFVCTFNERSSVYDFWFNSTLIIHIYAFHIRIETDFTPPYNNLEIIVSIYIYIRTTLQAT